MAPKRKGGASKKASKKASKEEVMEEVKEVVVEEAPAEPPTTEAEKEEKDEQEEEPASKKAKAEEKKSPAKRGKKGKAAAKPPPPPQAAVPPKEQEPAPPSNPEMVSKVIIIEASKECNSIKTRAEKVNTGLKKALPGLEVLINPDKPRKGCFEIRDQEGNVYVSLLAMPRPYTKLKNLDLDKTVEEIVAKIK